MAKSTELLLERGRVSRPLRDVCRGGEIRVAYNNAPGLYLMDWNDKMVEYEYDGSQSINHVTFPHEIITSFHKKHQLRPTYKYNYQQWGRYQWTGCEKLCTQDRMWNGAMGMVRDDIVILLVFRIHLIFFFLILCITLVYKLNLV